ncbi:hypothetical protein [Chitinibacter tainanensis]|uniref:hypothetical protein n=1 Tax=Chitinibacter tainanensis TaxID=230667 RepID=UPI0004125941|nr:hypothetical protein [Chitinibacter tainanensis]
MKTVICLSLLLAPPCFAIDLNKLFSEPGKLEQAIGLMKQQAQLDRSCPVLRDQRARTQRWLSDLQLQNGLMQIVPTQASTLDANAEAVRKLKIQLMQQISSLKLIVQQSQACLVQSIDWVSFCRDAHPSLAGQCSGQIPFALWLEQDWLCAEASPQCLDKLATVQTIQHASRELGQWALDSAQANNPIVDRASWQQLLGWSAVNLQ